MAAKGNKQNSKNTFNLELFFDMSPDLLCIAGYDGYFKRINPTVSKVLEYTNEELLAKPIHEFIYHEDKHLTAGHRENLLNDVPLLNFENRYVTKSGGIVWLHWTSMPIESEKVVFAIARNVTHKKRIEDDRNLLLTNLTELNNDLKQLAYMTSHDLRAPVSNLISVFSLLDVSKIEDQETLEFIEMMRTTTDSLKVTLNNFVDNLIEKNNLGVTVAEISFNECLTSALQPLQSLVKNSRAVLRVDFSAAEKVEFNKGYLESIFLNLISNSIKYSKPDSFPNISICTKRVNGRTRLIFSDGGMGFDMEKAKGKIFGFNQKFHEHTDSKGIGLYLVYNHVTSLGGQIAVESRINEGAKFTISFNG
ncbi:PAS domain-containing sensor histidine kinase [Mucilaginibacter xinganensis]|uniref:histidine kinase n=1 Tax=Mucilaginibacter xinganensis TaxID=1234841 RepID=A0A223NQC0_9SPHI|nr:PAS domain-containing sensor histidine kinase [Mucilaginibacter xinganensis]ASU31996.1 PAS domain S-box-containing protein [Mucilaginibacter xinganensis]